MGNCASSCSGAPSAPAKVDLDAEYDADRCRTARGHAGEVVHTSSIVSMPKQTEGGRETLKERGSGTSAKQVVQTSAPGTARRQRQRQPMMASKFTTIASAADWGTCQKIDYALQATQSSPLGGAPAVTTGGCHAHGVKRTFLLEPNLMHTPPPAGALHSDNAAIQAPIEIDASYHVSRGDPFGCDSERSSQSSGRSFRCAALQQSSGVIHVPRTV